MVDTVAFPTEGLNRIRDWLAGDSITQPSRLAVGTGTTGTTLATTAMESQTGAHTLTADKEGDAQVTWSVVLGTTQENGNAITEVGADDGTNDNLFSRQTGTAINKTASIILKIEKQITLANAT